MLYASIKVYKIDTIIGFKEIDLEQIIKEFQVVQ